MDELHQTRNKHRYNSSFPKLVNYFGLVHAILHFKIPFVQEFSTLFLLGPTKTRFFFHVSLFGGRAQVYNFWL